MCRWLRPPASFTRRTKVHGIDSRYAAAGSVAGAVIAMFAQPSQRTLSMESWRAGSDDRLNGFGSFHVALRPRARGDQQPRDLGMIRALVAAIHRSMRAPTQRSAVVCGFAGVDERFSRGVSQN